MYCLVDRTKCLKNEKLCHRQIQEISRFLGKYIIYIRSITIKVVCSILGIKKSIIFESDPMCI